VLQEYDTPALSSSTSIPKLRKNLQCHLHIAQGFIGVEARKKLSPLSKGKAKSKPLKYCELILPGKTKEPGCNCPVKRKGKDSG
jgi:hypothetical protein